MTRLHLGRLVLFGLLLVQAVSVSGPATAAPTSIRGSLTDQAAWTTYKTRFVSETGRVVDTGNARISHSEGQGYGMLLAVAADDRDTFERIWGWTRANLMVRDDALFAWRWEPDKRPAVADLNNASDGDILIAWALAEAAASWNQDRHSVAARRVAVEVGRKLVLPSTPHGALLLPGMTGFASEDRPDGPIVNLSYWVFPAFEPLALAAPEFDWAALSRNGVALVEKARFGPRSLPAEWTSLGDSEPKAAAGFPAVYGYNALRIPLYLAWAGLTLERKLDEDTKADGGFDVVDLNTGGLVSRSQDRGYAAVSALARCADGRAAWPADLLTPRADEAYYPVTLHLLALVALKTRYPTCARS